MSAVLQLIQFHVSHSNYYSKIFLRYTSSSGNLGKEVFGIFFLMSKTKECQELTLIIDFNTHNTQMRKKYTYIPDPPQIAFFFPLVYLVYITF